MKKLCFWIIFAFYSSQVWAETWLVHSTDFAGDTRETRWDIRREEGRVDYFLRGQDEPVYVLHTSPEGSQVALANGMIRRFSPGFLLLADLPLPVFLFDADGIENGKYCFWEYIGKVGFQCCVEVTVVGSLEQALSLPAPHSAAVILVRRGKSLVGIVGPDFRAERVNME